MQIAKLLIKELAVLRKPYLNNSIKIVAPRTILASDLHMINIPLKAQDILVLVSHIYWQL